MSGTTQVAMLRNTGRNAPKHTPLSSDRAETLPWTAHGSLTAMTTSVSTATNHVTTGRARDAHADRRADRSRRVRAAGRAAGDPAGQAQPHAGRGDHRDPQGARELRAAVHRSQHDARPC